MGEREKRNICDTPTDPSLEFDTFEYLRGRLTDALVGGGREPLEAAKIALYVVQGLRNVPKLLRVFSLDKPPAPDELMEALGSVLDEAPALEKARRLLLRIEQEDQD